MVHKCKRCLREFEYKNLLKRHLNRKKPCDPVVKKPKNKIGLICEFCNRKFSRRYTLIRHHNTCEINQNPDPVQENAKYGESTKKVVERIQDKLKIVEEERDRLEEFVDESLEKMELLETRIRFIENDLNIKYKPKESNYLLQEREFIKEGTPVFKIGRSTQENGKRLKQYPKGSRVVLNIDVDDCIKVEREIIKVFDEKFKKRKDIGNEYYEGDVNQMIKEFVKITTSQ